jgi:hypothetical protein
VKGQYDGESLTVEGILLEGGITILRGIEGRFLLDLHRGELSSVVGRISTGGTGLLGVLGTGARISIWYPGAR